MRAALKKARPQTDGAGILAETEVATAEVPEHTMREERRR